MSSLRVMLPSGAVVSAVRVVPIAERIIFFNGKRRRLTGLAQNMRDEANGLLIQVEGLKRRVSNNYDPFAPDSFNTPQERVEEDWDDVVIGNLRNEQVRQISRELIEKGYYDFSGLEYQKLGSTKDLMLGSEYLPYHNEYKPYLCAFSNRNNEYNKFSFANYYDEDITDGCNISEGDRAEPSDGFGEELHE